MSHKDQADFAATYLPQGRPPAPGEIFVNKNLAGTLKKIAAEGPDVFYRGEIAAKIVKFAQEKGGLHAPRDFANQTSNWVDPISVNYRGYAVYEMPPNTQGLTALEMLNILESFELGKLGHNTAEYLHLLVEAKKQAFIDRARHIADPAFYQAPLDKLLSKDYAAEMRKRIDAGASPVSPRPSRAAAKTPYI